MVVVAIDPGREKCGIAVASVGAVWEQRVVSKDGYLQVVRDMINEYKIAKVIVGDGTASADFVLGLSQSFPRVEVEIVDERFTSEEARKRYWEEHPPKGWRRFWPLGLQVPPQPFDDYVAVILAERFFKKNS